MIILVMGIPAKNGMMESVGNLKILNTDKDITDYNNV
jgi:hypothetical protein